jgi:hypothetical protein
VDSRIDEIVLKTLEKERSLRQQSATEVKTDVFRAMQAGGSKKAPAASETSGIAILACGLLLTGVLVTPLLMALLPRANSVVLFGVIAVLLSLILGLMCWRERLGKFVVISSGTLLLLAILFVPWISGPRISGPRRVSLGEPKTTITAREAGGGSEVPALEYDFSTPRDAMESIIKAANKGDANAFMRGLAKEVTEGPFYTEPELADRMREWEGITYSHQVSIDGDHAVVALRNPKIAENGALERYNMKRENGEWKFALTRLSDE